MLQHTAHATYCTIQHTSCISVQTYAIGTFHYIFREHSTTAIPTHTYAVTSRPVLGSYVHSTCPLGVYALIWVHWSIMHLQGHTTYVTCTPTSTYVSTYTCAVTNDNWQLQLVKREIQTRKCTYAIRCTPYVYVHSTVEWKRPPVTGDST